MLVKEGAISIRAGSSPAIYRGAVASFQKKNSANDAGPVSVAARKRLDILLSLVVPLTLTDLHAGNFRPPGCGTIHDVIRFCHEKAVASMFGISDNLDDAATFVKLTTHLPVLIRCVDLGGGRRHGLTTCDVVTPDDVTSLPSSPSGGGSRIRESLGKEP
ncbi:MAG TPA: hypothetical protein VLH56_09510 [Dissulfurispiraceae bacterium]|nr:hypothetical protein [Dissulfurispiraceae bacterium]